MKVRTFVVAALALTVFAVGCKSKDEQVAEALTQELLEPIRKAKEAGDPKDLGTHCLAMSMALEAPEIAEQIKQDGAAKKVVDELHKLCDGAPSLGEMVNQELEKELEKGEQAAPDED